ncbi:MAG TPA: MFS transporter [Solirubrobacteraceae bacterium]|nr:MFS transporter [Solirubrobacteraceae bacterium]
MPRSLVALLALTTGTAVANLYYIQPLLGHVGQEFHVSDGTAGLLVTFTQIGYLIGLVLLVPLGDLLERRRLLTILLLGAAVVAAGCAGAPSFALLALGLAVLAGLSALAQIVVPLASALAAPHERGQVVGIVMSGLLLGILLARTLSGAVAEIGGWRLSISLAAVSMLVMCVLLHRALPPSPPTEEIRYRTALASVLALIREEPVLRQRMVLTACGFGGFSVLWTSAAFLLSGSPYQYSEGVIGLFGLAGAAGALAAPVAGRIADRGYGRIGMSAFLVAVLASWALLALGSSSVIALIAGIALLDLGVQGAHISNQATVYLLRPEARSRLTTAYIVAMFLGGIAGSLLSATIYSASGWSAVCVLGAAIALMAIVVWAATWRVGTVQSAAAQPARAGDGVEHDHAREPAGATPR